MSRITVIMAAALMCAGCSEPAPTTATVRGVSYVIPAREVTSEVLTLPSRIYVRTAPPGADFDLILDAFRVYLPNKQGPGVPTISALNDNRFGKFEVIASADGPVVCYVEPIGPRFNCGISIDDGPVKWSALFDRDQLGRVAAIRREARATIARYLRSAA